MESNELKPSRIYQLPYLVDYAPRSVVVKHIMKKDTGIVSIYSIAKGEVLDSNISPFNHLIQIIDGVAEVIVDDQSMQLKTGQIIIIPAHTTNKIKATKRFKMLSIVIKSGYEDVNLWLNRKP